MARLQVDVLDDIWNPMKKKAKKQNISLRDYIQELVCNDLGLKIVNKTTVTKK